MNWSSKKVLVTGAGGFIGSHLTEQLVALGASVRAFVRYNSRNDWGLIDLLSRDIQESIEIFAGDLKDPEAVRESVRGRDIVFHLGALIAIPYSYVNPMDYVQTNICGTAHILNSCREHAVEKLVHTSTSEVYGTAQYTPIDEKHPLRGQSPYSASKIAADKLAESSYLSFGVPIAVLRPFNTFGPRQSARAVIPTIITQALTEAKMRLGSLEPTRDITYISDTVNGFIAIAECPEANGEVISIGTGEEISIKELVTKICSILGKKMPVEHDTARVRPKRSEVERLICDNRKAQAILNWKPKVTVEKGLEKTIDWISQHLHRYKTGRYNI